MCACPTCPARRLPIHVDLGDRLQNRNIRCTVEAACGTEYFARIADVAHCVVITLPWLVAILVASEPAKLLETLEVLLSLPLTCSSLSCPCLRLCRRLLRLTTPSFGNATTLIESVRVHVAQRIRADVTVRIEPRN